MNEEILRIQQMVAAGKITPEEATELVESLVRQNPAPPAPTAVEHKCRAGGPGTASFVMFSVGLFLFLLDVAGNCRTGNTAVTVMAALGFIFGLAGYRALAGKGGLIGSALLLALMVIAPFFFFSNHNQHKPRCLTIISPSAPASTTPASSSQEAASPPSG